MKSTSQFLKKTIGISFSVTFVSLSVSAWGAVIENSHMANFWYLAFCGILMLAAASALISVMFVLKSGIEWYRRLLHTWVGYPVDI